MVCWSCPPRIDHANLRYLFYWVIIVISADWLLTLICITQRSVIKINISHSVISNEKTNPQQLKVKVHAAPFYSENSVMHTGYTVSLINGGTVAKSDHLQYGLKNRQLLITWRVGCQEFLLLKLISSSTQVRLHWIKSSQIFNFVIIFDDFNKTKLF